MFVLPAFVSIFRGSVYSRLKLWKQDRPGLSGFTLLGFIKLRDKYMYSAWQTDKKIFCLLVIFSNCLYSNNK